MSRTTVSCLERLLATCLGLPHGQRNGGRSTIDLQKQVLITIWILRNPECLRSVADRFNITKSSAFRVYRKICGAITNNLAGQYMKYPLVWNWAPLGKMINFGSFAQRNALDQWSVFRSRRSMIHKSLSRVDLINHWSENGFARKEPHRSEILIRILSKERTLSETWAVRGHALIINEQKKIRFENRTTNLFFQTAIYRLSDRSLCRYMKHSINPKSFTTFSETSHSLVVLH